MEDCIQTLNNDASVVYRIAVQNHRIAVQNLAHAKAEEMQQKRMYRWTRGSLVVSRNSEEGLRETVKELGYEWNEGRFGDKA